MPDSTASRTRNWAFLSKCQAHVLPENLPNYLSTTHILFPLETKYLKGYLPMHALHSRSSRRCCMVKRIPWPKKWEKFNSKLSLPLEDSWYLLAKKSTWEVLQEKRKEPDRLFLTQTFPDLFDGQLANHPSTHLSSIHLAIVLNIWLLRINCVNPCAMFSTHSPCSYFPTFYPHQNLHEHYQSSSSSSSQLPPFIYSKLTLL